LGVARRYVSRPSKACSTRPIARFKSDFSHRAPIMSSDEIAVLALRSTDMLDERDVSSSGIASCRDAADFVYITDLTAMLSVNKAAEQITGYRRERALKMRIDDLAVPPCARSRHMRK